MKLFFIFCLTIALNFRAIGQTFLLTESEYKLVNEATIDIGIIPKYFVYIDVNDCFNCTLSSSLIKKNIDSSQVFILANQISKNSVEDFIQMFSLSISFKYIYNEQLINIFKLKANSYFKDKSFIIEINSMVATIIPLKKFKDNQSFSTNLRNVSEHEIYNKGKFISSISKFIPYKNDFIAFTNPKSSICYFSNDSIKSEIIIDSFMLKFAYNYVISKQNDSIQNINSFNRCLKTYNNSIKQLGFSLITSQNFNVYDSSCFAIIQVSFPVWTNDSNVTIIGELFFLKSKLIKPLFLMPEELIPIDRHNLHNGMSVFSYNFFNYYNLDSSIKLGYYLDSIIIKDSYYNLSHCTYKVIDGVYKKTNDCKIHPIESINEYKNLQNISLIHNEINNESYNYTYLPVLINGNSKIRLMQTPNKNFNFHSLASKIVDSIYIDFCIVNTKYYLFKYEINGNNYKIIDIKNLFFDGIVQSAYLRNKGFDYIILKNGTFKKGIIMLPE